MTEQDQQANDRGPAGAETAAQPEDSIVRRARRYHEVFPDIPEAVIAGHLAVISGGNAMARAVTRHLEQYGINPARYSLLRAIYFAPERMLPQSRLALEMGTSQPNVTQLLHALEKEGLVERVIFAENRRVTFARLTDLGVKRCDVLVPDMVRFMQRSVGALTDEELAELLRLMTRLRAGVEDLQPD